MARAIYSWTNYISYVTERLLNFTYFVLIACNTLYDSIFNFPILLLITRSSNTFYLHHCRRWDVLRRECNVTLYNIMKSHLLSFVYDIMLVKCFRARGDKFEGVSCTLWRIQTIVVLVYTHKTEIIIYQYVIFITKLIKGLPI